MRGRRLLGIDREFVNVDGLGVEAEADWDHLRTPETYLGYERSEHFVSRDSRTGRAPGRGHRWPVRALVLLATFGSLRWGELAALTRRHIDLDACTVQVVSWLTETDSGTLFTGPQIHFHDLRHTGNILTATAGASLRELMARMGHASTRAALVYLHDTDDRQRIIAAAVSDLAGQQLGQLVLPETSPEEGSGT